MDSPIQFLSMQRKNASHAPHVCYSKTLTTPDGFWFGDDPLSYTIPLFLLQLLLIISVTRITSILLRPLHLPRHISEIIGGFMLGPSVMGRIPNFSIRVFPLRSLLVLDGMAHLGLIYFIFTVGIDLESKMLTRTGSKYFAFALANHVPPVAVGTATALMLGRYHRNEGSPTAFLTFLGAAFSVSAFSVLPRLLAELKLIGSEVGRLALSTAILSDAVAWVLLTIAIGLAQRGDDPLINLGTVLSGVAFLTVNFAVVKPAVIWVAEQTPEGEDVEELPVCAVLAGVMVAALAADALGMHCFYGALVYGAMVPKWPLGVVLVEKIGDFTSGLLLPLFFVVSGLRTDVTRITDKGSAALMVTVATTIAVGKVVSHTVVAFLCNMTLHDGVSIGLLMNVKGVIDLIILNIGKDKELINDQSFTVLVIMSVVVEAVVSSLLTTVAKPSRRLASYKRRTIRWPNPESELRLVACLHSSRNVPSLLALIDASHPTKRSPIFVYALQLIELAGRASSMLVINSATATATNDHLPGQGRIQADADHISHAFQAYEQHAAGVSVQWLTAFSPYDTMHEDVAAVTEDKHAALLLLPFHKIQTVDGGLEAAHPAIRAFNLCVLASAPCTVAIIIDRGYGRGGGADDEGQRVRRVVLLFFGGPDDREALAYAARMAGHPTISLTVVRFVSGTEQSAVGRPHPAVCRSPRVERVVTVFADDDREQAMDDECYNDFAARWGCGLVEFTEEVTSNAEETVAAIRAVEARGYDLFVVGRGQGWESPLTAGLTDWSECPELGPIGDLLASPDFSETVSVLVVQQGGGGGAGAVAGVMSPDSVQLYLSKADNRTKGSQGW